MYVIVWEFELQAGKEREFEEAYAGNGQWAKLFARSSEYRGTDLLRPTDGGPYLTIDRWSSADAFATFQRQWRLEYEELDRRCEALTRRETLVGRFETT